MICYVSWVFSSCGTDMTQKVAYSAYHLLDCNEEIKYIFNPVTVNEALNMQLPPPANIAHVFIPYLSYEIL